MDINGKKIAEEYRAALKHRIETEGIQAKLVFILVGEDYGSQSYVRMKTKACKEVGIQSEKIELREKISEEFLLEIINKLNLDPSVNGILVQMPLPKHIREENILLAIDPNKDVDGFHPLNVGKMITGDPSAIISCTPLAVLKLLEAYNIETSGKHIVILGRSNIVGRPLANLLSQKRPFGNATVTLAHSHTKNLGEITRQADILIAAIGKARFVTGEMIKKGAVVIDIGINRLNTQIVGDVDYTNVAPLCSYITPVPGGVGPMTIAMLLENTIRLTLQTNQYNS